MIVVYITTGSKKEAEKIAKSLVEEHLVACVNYFPINSIFYWNGKVEEENEYALICKTTKDKFKEVEERVRELHSYDVPAIIVLPIIDGSNEFLNWIRSEVNTTS